MKRRQGPIRLWAADYRGRNHEAAAEAVLSTLPASAYMDPFLSLHGQ